LKSPVPIQKSVNVVQFFRKPFAGQVSIEKLFSQIRAALPPWIDCRCHINPKENTGVGNRIINLQVARREQAMVNHVTGDIHYLALSLKPSRTILTIHDCVSLHRLHGFRRSLFYFFWYYLPIRSSKIVTSISSATKDELIKICGPIASKIRVVHNCVSPEYRPSNILLREGGPLKLLQIGTGANKNLERVAHSIRGLNCQLHIIGKLTSNQRQVLAENSVRYTHQVYVQEPELIKAYQECDLLVFASTYEGFGLPIIEAQAIGRPVITSNTSSMPEVANGAAIIVDPFDVQAIRKGIEILIQNPDYKSELVEKGFRNVQRFSVDSIASQYAQIYRELAPLYDGTP
jgi:glycosyltransferase involved in cell wall biosynthesis